jgi:hypothetical protein
MLIRSSIDGSTLMEVKLEGSIEVDPTEARMMLNALLCSQLGAHAVVKVGEAPGWIKLESQVGTVHRYCACGYDMYHIVTTKGK